MRFPVFLLLALTGLWLSCEREPEAPAPPPLPADSLATPWQLHPAIRLTHRYLIAGHATENHLLLATPSHLLVLNRDGQLVVEAQIPVHPLTSWVQPLLGERAIIFPELVQSQFSQWDLSLQLRLRDPLQPEHYTDLDLRTYDSLFVRLPANWGPPLVYTADHRLMVPVVRRQPDPTAWSIDSLQRILVFRIESSRTGPQATLERTLVHHPYSYANHNHEIGLGYHDCISVGAVREVAYFSLHDPPAVIKAGPGPMAEFVTHAYWAHVIGLSDRAVMLGCDLENRFFWAEQKQSPWQRWTFPVDAINYRQFRFVAIADSVVGFTDGVMARFAFDTETRVLSTDEISNHGIANRPRINDLVSWQGQVFALTTDGLYYKSTDDFFEYVAPE